MPKSRGKTPGWAAVDLKLRHGEVEPDVESDPYPPVQNAIDLPRPSQNVTRPFTRPMSSSIIVPPSWAGSPAVTKEIESELRTEGHVSSKNYKYVVIDDNIKKLSLERLVHRYCMADPYLIEDILLAVDNDFDSASRVLEEMYPTKRFSKQEGTSNGYPNSPLKDNGLGVVISDTELCLNSALERTLTRSGPCDWFADSHNGFQHSYEQSSNALASVESTLENLKLIQSEPEWEEDDVYLSHRKDAIKLMRSAAQHSRMASSAFLKGDHYNAQHHSLRAREDWSAANNLNLKAAKEILSVNNQKNDIWKLDLHGLHAAEAVKALHNHLTMIETQSSSHRSLSPKRVSSSRSLAESSSSESLSCLIKDSDLGTGISKKKQRPTTLQVITGRGLHSKGLAALPATVRGFLDGNGYRYDEPRPGVISVRPKYGRG